jgi:hypothetical protein
MHFPHRISSTRPLTRLFALTLIVLAAAFVAPFMSSAGAESRPVCERHSSIEVVCFISGPEVQSRMTTYPIPMLAGQRVSFYGWGCVQTGGHGKTWKRYVDPIAPDAPNLYTGTIEIPGTTGSRTLRSIGQQTFTVQRNTTLRAGYEDGAGSYGDNGYWGRSGDDGTFDQCKNQTAAGLQVTIIG